VISSRTTTSMVQRNVLADLNNVYSKLARTQARASSGRQITRPSDDPFNASRAMGLRQALDGNTQYQRNIQDAQGWQDATEAALSGINDFLKRARTLVVQGASDTVDQSSRDSIAEEIDQIVNGVKETSNAQYAGSYLMSGTATDVAPYTQGADDAYKGDDAGLNPAIPGVLREIGPGVTMSINTVAHEILGDGQSAADDKLLDVLRDVADHLRANDGASLKADLARLDANQETLLAARARNGARSNRLEAAAARLDDIGQALTKQLSDTEDADIAQTMIDFNSQSVAYQAALKAGANIVQSSLMDFLR
jgi:flagellar hook-associated protein 3 FlgL